MEEKIELPELPRGKGAEELSAWPGMGNPNYTADQMLAYARQAVLKERERCARLCEDSEPLAGAFVHDIARCIRRG